MAQFFLGELKTFLHLGNIRPNYASSDSAIGSSEGNLKGTRSNHYLLPSFPFKVDLVTLLFCQNIFMDCKFYGSCQKEHSCPFLGECVFGHKMIIESPSTQAKIQLHYGQTAGAIFNVLRKIKRGKPFIGDESNDAKKHLKKIVNKHGQYDQTLDDTVKILLAAPPENFHYL